MDILKHYKVLHERVILLEVRTETPPRVPDSSRFEISPLSADFSVVRLHFGFLEQPNIPRALAAMRKVGFKFDIMTTSFFLGRRTFKAAIPGMPVWQSRLFLAMTKQAASAPDFFNLPSDRVVEIGAQTTV
jgi:KUP system potassium uptake protein